MNLEKIKNILKLDNQERYLYSIREIVKLKKIWAISTPDSWVTFVDSCGDEIFPIWPHKEVAEICIFDELKVDGYYIESIDYDKFKNYCIPDMENENIHFGLFYDKNREAIVVKSSNLVTDLEEEENVF